MSGSKPSASEQQGAWRVQRGSPSTDAPKTGYTRGGTEILNYNNPYAQEVERAWFDGKLVYALSGTELKLPSPEGLKVANEYQPVYSVELDKDGHAKKEPEMVPGQYNIYDSVPGMQKYSPIWQYSYVVVPRDYKAQSLRSEEDCKKIGYPIHKSNDFEN